MFRALVLHEADRKVTAGVETLDDDRLPDGDVTVAVEHSSLNYKDGLILKGLARLVRTYPHVPGIDLAGTVVASSNPAYTAGDRVICTGWRVGEVHWGGFAERARVRGEWLVPCPPSLSTHDAMALGTAGLTVMMSIEALEAHGLRAGDGPVLVTGAAGGVGSLAVHLLARLGYEVAASTGRPETHDYLRTLGATDIVERSELTEAPAKPLLSERWAGVIDNVGGTTLAHVLAELRQAASAAAVGNAGGNDFPGNVIPFLLRGVRLLGIDSAAYPMEHRRQAWARLAETIDRAVVGTVTRDAGLDELPALADEILAGRIRGRVVVAP